MPTFVPVSYIDYESSLPIEGKPVSYIYAKNHEQAPDFGSLYGQDIEPAGFYHTCNSSFEPTKNYTAGLIEFKYPLVIHNDDSPIEWKSTLSNRYNKLSGKSLSDAITSDGYDGIITTSEYTRGNGQVVQVLGECVSLRGEITEIEGALQAYVPFSLKRLDFDQKWQNKLNRLIELRPELEDWILKKAKDNTPYFMKKADLLRPTENQTIFEKSDILRELSNTRNLGTNQNIKL